MLNKSLQVPFKVPLEVPIKHQPELSLKVLLGHPLEINCLTCLSHPECHLEYQDQRDMIRTHTSGAKEKSGGGRLWVVADKKC